MCLYANIKVQFQRRDKIGRNIQRQAFRNEIIASLFSFREERTKNLSNTKPDTNPFKNHKSADNMSINKTIMSPPDYIVSCCILRVVVLVTLCICTSLQNSMVCTKRF